MTELEERDFGSVRLVEHLKNFVGVVLDAFHEGSGLEGQPITFEVAKSLVWKEIERCVLDQDSSFNSHVAWLRISGDLPVLENVDVISLRRLGARTDTDTPISYAVVAVEDYAELLGVVTQIKEKGFEVRDFTFGCYRY
jgi:hypothetical protein